MKVLIVDDNGDDRKLLRLNLERHGCEAVFEARDGREGFDLAMAHMPDLIISDALMPRLDGFQFLHLIKMEEEFKSVPFVFHSSVYTGLKDEELAFSLGAEAFITKPKEPEEFWRELTAILKGLEARKKRPEPPALLEEEKEYLRQYSGVVAAKLEEKVRELEESLARRKEAEETLLKLSLAVEQSPVTIVITDVSGKIEYVNPKFTQLTGYTFEEALGQNPRILKSGQTPPEEYRLLWETITKGNIWQGKFCNKNKNGELYWESASISPIIGREGVISHFVAVKEDITERKRAEEELLLDSIRFQNLYELSIMDDAPENQLFDFSLEAAVQITGSAIGFLYFLNGNETVLTFHTWSKGGKRGCAETKKPSCKITETGFLGGAVRGRVPVFTNDSQAPSLLENGYPDGDEPIRRQMTVPLIDNGKIVLLVGVGNKKTEYNETDAQQVTLLMAAMWRIIQERRTERSLHESEDRFRQIFAQDDDALIIFRAGSLEIIDANPMALSLFGLTKGNLSRVKPESFMEPDDFRKFTEAITINDSSRGFIIDRMACTATGGARLTVSLRAKILGLKDESVIFCSFRDMTDKIRLEEEIRATQAKLIQTNKMTSLGLLVSSVAHEINNPNSYISSNATILARTWQDAAPILQEYQEKHGNFSLGGLPSSEMQELVPRLLSSITDGSRRIAKIVNNMREFVKDEKGRAAGIVEINGVIRSAADILWHHIRKYTDNFRLELADGLPPLRGSRQQLEQVVINLVMNALQSLPGKQSGVFVTTSHDRETGAIIIMVRDEGKGMGRKAMEQLKEPFFTTKLDEGGTGLGLYISDSIIREHRGSLEFESEQGRGTTATIRLPAADGDPGGTVT